MNNENRKEHERKRSWPDLCYPEISPEGVRKTTRSLSQDSQSPGRDLNTSPPEYKAGILTTLPPRSVPCVCVLRMFSS
jgi:hypothetical protein